MPSTPRWRPDRRSGTVTDAPASHIHESALRRGPMRGAASVPDCVITCGRFPFAGFHPDYGSQII